MHQALARIALCLCLIAWSDFALAKKNVEINRSELGELSVITRDALADAKLLTDPVEKDYAIWWEFRVILQEKKAANSYYHVVWANLEFVVDPNAKGTLISYTHRPDGKLAGKVQLIFPEGSHVDEWIEEAHQRYVQYRKEFTKARIMIGEARVAATQTREEARASRAKEERERAALYERLRDEGPIVILPPLPPNALDRYKDTWKLSAETASRRVPCEDIDHSCSPSNAPYLQPGTLE